MKMRHLSIVYFLLDSFVYTNFCTYSKQSFLCFNTSLEFYPESSAVNYSFFDHLYSTLNWVIHGTGTGQFLGLLQAID